VPEANTGKTYGTNSGAGTPACALTSVDSQRTIAAIGPPNPILAGDRSLAAPASCQLFWPHPAVASTARTDATIFVSLLLAV